MGGSWRSVSALQARRATPQTKLNYWLRLFSVQSSVKSGHGASLGSVDSRLS